MLALLPELSSLGPEYSRMRKSSSRAMRRSVVMLSPKVEAEVLFNFDCVDLSEEVVAPGDALFEDVILSPVREVDNVQRGSRQGGTRQRAVSSPLRATQEKPFMEPDRRLENTAAVTSESELMLVSAVAMLNESMGLLHAKAHRAPSPSPPEKSSVQQPAKMTWGSPIRDNNADDGEGVLWPASATQLLPPVAVVPATQVAEVSDSKRPASVPTARHSLVSVMPGTYRSDESLLSSPDGLPNSTPQPAMSRLPGAWSTNTSLTIPELPGSFPGDYSSLRSRNKPNTNKNKDNLVSPKSPEPSSAKSNRSDVSARSDMVSPNSAASNQRSKRRIPTPSPIPLKQTSKDSPRLPAPTKIPAPSAKPRSRKAAQPESPIGPPPTVMSFLAPKTSLVGVPGYARATVASIKREFY